MALNEPQRKKMTVEKHRPGTHSVLLWPWSCARRPQAPMKKSRTTRRTTPSPVAISLYHSIDVNNTTESTPTLETSRSGDNPTPARPSAPDAFRWFRDAVSISHEWRGTPHITAMARPSKSIDDTTMSR